MSGPQRRSCGGGGWCHHISPDFLIDWIKAQFVEFVFSLLSLSLGTTGDMLTVATQNYLHIYTSTTVHKQHI